MSKRSKSKYPALERGLNLKSRKDFIEVDYVDGVRNKNGELVIRAMTDEEKKWLNQYYEETVVTNFLHHPDLKRLNREKKDIIECALVRKLKSQVDNIKEDYPDQVELIKELKEMIKLTKEQNSEKFAQELRQIEDSMQNIRDAVLLYPDKEDHKQFYKENNKRNVCIYNSCKKTGTLLEFDTDAYDTFMSKNLNNVDHEMLLVTQLDKGKKE